MMKIEFDVNVPMDDTFSPLNYHVSKLLECERVLRDITRKIENGCTKGDIMSIDYNKIGEWSID